MKKLKLIRKQTPALIDFILDTWRGYMILSVSRFSWSRRKLGVFQHVITVIFCLLFLRVMFVKETFDIAMSKSRLLLFITYTLSVFCSMSAVNNSCLFVKTGIDINLSYSKAATICQIKDIPSLLRLFLKKLDPNLSTFGTEFVQTVACRNIVLGLSGYCSRFCVQGWIIWLCSRWRHLVRARLAVPSGWCGLKIGEIKPSGLHDYYS